MRKLAVIIPVLLLAGQAAAAPGAEYEAEKARLTAMGPRGLSLVKARQAESAYSESTWREDVRFDAILFWMERPEQAQRAYDLAGLKPEVYLKKRRPIPEATRELSELGVAPVLFELLLFTKDRYPFATGSAEERAALDDALVVALGRSQHPAAHHALLDLVRDAEQPEHLRSLAAHSLGVHGREQAESTLAELVRDSRLAPEIRHGAVRGLGQVRTARSIGLISSVLLEARTVEMRNVAIRALGSAASPTVLRRRNAPEALRVSASDALVEALRRPEAVEVGDALVETIAVVRHPAAMQKIAALQETELSDAHQDLVSRAAHRLRRALRR